MITDLQSLRALYPAPGERALRKQLTALDRHCRAFITLSPFAVDKRGRLVIEVDVEEAYLHCAKSPMRSRLWSDAARVQRSVLPTIGQMINDQMGIDAPAENPPRCWRAMRPTCSGRAR